MSTLLEFVVAVLLVAGCVVMTAVLGLITLPLYALLKLCGLWPSDAEMEAKKVKAETPDNWVDFNIGKPMSRRIEWPNYYGICV